MSRLGLVVALLWSTASAQTPTIRSQVELVVTPVIVRDGKGAPLRGLTAADFTISDNQKKQRIAVFQEVSGAAPAAPGPGTMPPVGTPAVSAAEPLQVFLVLDFLNTPVIEQEDLRKSLLRYFERKPSGTAFTIYLLSQKGMVQLHPATADPIALAAIVDKTKPRLGATGANGDLPLPDSAEENLVVGGAIGWSRAGERMEYAAKQGYAARYTLACLDALADRIGAIPGHKSVLWASSGFPFNVSATTQTNAGIPIMRQHGKSNTRPSDDEWERFFRHLMAMNISIYPWDQGRQPVAEYDADFSRPETRAEYVEMQRAGLRDTLQQVADLSGGTLCSQSTSLPDCVGHIAADNADYYVIGYYLPAAAKRAPWHAVRIAVARPGAHLRYRNGFYELPDQPDASKP